MLEGPTGVEREKEQEQASGGQGEGGWAEGSNYWPPSYDGKPKDFRIEMLKAISKNLQKEFGVELTPEVLANSQPDIIK